LRSASVDTGIRCEQSDRAAARSARRHLEDLGFVCASGGERVYRTATVRRGATRCSGPSSWCADTGRYSSEAAFSLAQCVWRDVLCGFLGWGYLDAQSRVL